MTSTDQWVYPRRLGPPRPNLDAQLKADVERLSGALDAAAEQWTEHVRLLTGIDPTCHIPECHLND